MSTRTVIAALFPIDGADAQHASADDRDQAIKDLARRVEPLLTHAVVIVAGLLVLMMLIRVGLAAWHGRL